MSRHSSASHFHKSKTLNDKYLLGDEIGKGAYGRVYKGLDLENGDFVAIKQVSLENIPAEDLASIMQEIDLLKNLNHKNIVKYQGSFKTKTHLYIILEYVENGSLASIVKPNKFGAFPESLVAVYITQVLEGLAYLHEQGVIHRDIKGANILTTKEGLVKLADFGVATKLTEADVNTHSVVGTPYWMAPEVIEMSGVSASSDIWSVGCTVIELLTCVPPYYDLQPMPALFRIVQDDHPPIPEHLSSGITDFLYQCFRKDAKLRPDAKTLLKHPWVKDSRRAIQNSLRTGGRMSNIPQDVSTVLERTMEDNKDDHRTSSQDVISRDHPESGSDDDGKPSSPKLAVGSAPIADSNGTIKHQEADIASPVKDIPGDASQLSKSCSPESFTKTVPLSEVADTVERTIAQDENHHTVDTAVLPMKHASQIEAQAEEDDVVTGLSNHKTRKRDYKISDPSKVSTASMKELSRFSDTPADGILDDLFEEPGVKTEDEAESILVPPLQISRDVIAVDNKGGGLAAKLKRKMLEKKFEGKRNGSDFLRQIISVGEDDTDLGFGSNAEGKDYYAKQAMEVTRLIGLLKPEESEDVVISTCQKLVVIFRDFPEQKSHLITQHGVMPLVEMLEINNNRVVHAVLLLVNQIIKDNIEIQENACLVGLIPIILNFAAAERSKEMRMQAAYFVQQVCTSKSASALQMFIACRGLPVLVAFLESDYAKYREMVHLAIDCMWQVFGLKSPTPRNDFCRIFAKSGVLTRLVNTLHSLNEATRFASVANAAATVVGTENTAYRSRSGPIELSKLHTGNTEHFRPRSGQLDPIRVRASYADHIRQSTTASESPRVQPMHKAQVSENLRYTSGQQDHHNIVSVPAGEQQHFFDFGQVIQPDTEQAKPLLVNLEMMRSPLDHTWQQEDTSHASNGSSQVVNSSQDQVPQLLRLFEKDPLSRPVSGQLDFPRGASGVVEKVENPLPSLHHSGATRKVNGDLEMLMTAYAEKGDLGFLQLNQEGSSRMGLNGSTGIGFKVPNPSSQASGALHNGHEQPSSTSGLISQSASGLLSVSGVLNGRPGSTSSSGVLCRMVSSLNAEVAREYLGKAADLLLEFSHADTIVKSSMCTLSILIRLLTMLNKLEAPILVKVLKCIKQLSMDPYTLEPLQRADAIKHLVPFLDTRDGHISQIHNQEIHNQVLNALFNLCKINKRRQEQAAECGIIPHLIHFITTNSPLKQFALPLLCDMAHASRNTREQLRVHNGLEIYLNLLNDDYWAVTALDSLAVCLAHDNEHRKIEQALIRKESVQKLVAFFQSCSGPSFVHILEPFLKMINKSVRLNTALAISGLTPLLVGRLDHQDAIARLNLLKLIKAVYEHHPRPKQLIVEHDLPSKLQKLIEERRDGERSGGQVLVKQMATALLKALHINTVL